MEHLDDDTLSLCEAVQISLEMEARGALPPEHRDRLESHTRDCAECRHFREVVARTDRSLRELRQSHAETARLTEAEARLARIRRQMHRQRWFPLMFAAFLYAAFGLMAAVDGLPHTARLWTLAVLFPLLMAGAAWRSQRKVARRLADPQVDVVATHRHMLQQGIRSFQQLAKVQYFLLPLVAFKVLRFATRGIDVVDVVTTVAMIGGGIFALIAVRRRVPELRRQLARMG